MDTSRENICCHSYPKVKDKLKTDCFGPCITGHVGLIGNCLNQYVLETSFFQYLEMEGPIGDEEEVNG